jgi:hypothetical protein
MLDMGPPHTVAPGCRCHRKEVNSQVKQVVAIYATVKRMLHPFALSLCRYVCGSFDEIHVLLERFDGAVPGAA